jgi:tetratricopeptide (TPR) repeat protein
LLAAGGILPLLAKEFKPWLWQTDGHLNWVLYLQSAVFVASGSQILLMAAAEFLENRDARSLVLLLWVLGLILFATVIYMFPNGRILLPMMPAIGILAARRLEKKIELARPGAVGKLLWPAVPALALSLLLVHADCRLANTGRAAAQELLARYLHPGQTLWFEGHWGFQYYMERGGAKPLERGFEQPKPGDVVVVPSEAVNAFDFPAQLVRLVDTLEYAPTPHYSTMSSSAGAGFYAATAGPFPFSAGHVDPERYYVFEVTGTLAAAAAPGGVKAAGAMAQLFELERKTDACASTLRQHPQDARVRLQLAIYLNQLRRTGQAIEQYRMLLRQTPDFVRALDDLAWILATDHEQRWRNGPEAMRLAQRANELTAGNSPDVLTTLGAAYAEAGNFESAVEAAEKAIQLARKAGQPEVISTNERLLRLYRASQPYHQ